MKRSKKPNPVIFNYLSSEKEISRQFRESIVVLAKIIYDELTSLGITLYEKKLTRRSIKTLDGIDFDPKGISIISFSALIDERVLRRCEVGIVNNGDIFFMFMRGKLPHNKKYEDVHWKNYIGTDLSIVTELKKYNQLVTPRGYLTATDAVSVLDEVAVLLKK